MANIALPIEIKTREFDGKLWLAMNLACSGHKVSLGWRNPMRSYALRHIEPDLFISKAAAKSDSRIKLFQVLNDVGCSIAVLDAEGGIIRSKADYFEKRLSKDILDSVDLLFAWGSEPADAVRENTIFPKEKMIVSGNPRFDLLHSGVRDIYTKGATEICDDFGNYALVNTNFAIVNHKKDSYIPSSGDLSKYVEFIIEQFIEAIYRISTINNLDTIVVRPHPSEDPDFYRKKFAGMPSVVVEQSGDVRTWIMGAEVVLHNSCTTGIESAMLNTPVLALEPDDAPIQSPRPSLPNAVSESVTSLEQLATRVEHYLGTDATYEMSAEQRSALKKYFENVDEPATEKIVRAIDETVSTRQRSYPAPSPIDRAKIWAKRGSLSPLFKTVLRRDFERSEYSKQKFPGLTIDEVRSRVSDFEAVSQINNIRVEHVHPFYDIYWIYQNGTGPSE